ncbi:MAG: DUF1800 domain-containing protein [Acidobacteria bacterium]|nr:DUF1800 domain-containing protein [Acidobacteriota bacterium]
MRKGTLLFGVFVCLLSPLTAQRQEPFTRGDFNRIVVGLRVPQEEESTLSSEQYRRRTLVAWDERSAAHLLRRLGFSASSTELKAAILKGFAAVLDEQLNYSNLDNSQMEQALAAKNYQLVRTDAQGRRTANTSELQSWWLFRMINSKHQLLEKMTYFWHDHFATSINQINMVGEGDRPLMLIQNELLRQYALGNFKELVTRIARDPAMLYWLDNVSNVKGRPNENWARELMELFTMGIGNYTEQDVKEAARAFTGWGVDRVTQNFRFYPERHDSGQKIFLGANGNFNGDDVIDLIFQKAVTAEFISKKLFEFFVYPNPSQEIILELGKVFRDSGYNIPVLLRAIFEHPEFFSPHAYRAHIKSPVEFVVGAYRELEITDPGTLQRQMSTMNQNLFAPPDVDGWVSGVGWINTSTLIARYNFLNTLATRRTGTEKIDVDRIIETQGLKRSEDVAQYFVSLFVQHDVSDDTYYALEQYLRTSDAGVLGEFDINNPTTVDKKVRGLIYLVSILPEYQLN